MSIVFLACLINLVLLIEKLKKRNFALQHDHYAVIFRRRVTQLTKNGLNAQQQRLHDCKIPQKLEQIDKYTKFSGFLWVCLHKFGKLSTSKHTK